MIPTFWGRQNHEMEKGLVLAQGWGEGGTNIWNTEDL